ncbi:Cell division control protein 14 [Rhodotorula toruloides]|nr:Cell division control protein 14 [Rhodotorula toruloides]
MGARSLKATLATVTDTLVSLRSTRDQHAAALAQLETLVASLVLDPQHPLLSAFLRFQDSFDRNVTVTLLEWLGRELAGGQDFGGAHYSEGWTNIVRCLKLVQGLLLLHRPSQRLFARKSSLEYLLAVLDMSRPHPPNSPLLSSPKPAPSPVLFPPSPFSSPNLASATAPSVLPTTQLALAALDTLLCALVDRPKNMRKFEENGGLSAIVKVLKDKNVPQAVRIKVVELLYYYLLPEANNPLSPGPPSPDSSFSSLARSTLSTLSSQVLVDATNLPTLFASAADFVPQTPVKPKARSSMRSEAPPPFSPSGRSSYSASSRDSSPTRTPRRTTHSRSQSMASLSTLTATPTRAAHPPAPGHKPRRSLAASSSSSRLDQYSRPPRSPRLSTTAEDEECSTPRSSRAARLSDPPSLSSNSSTAPSPRRSIHQRAQSTTSLSSYLPRSSSSRKLASPDLEPTPRPPRIRLSKDSNDADAEDMHPPRRPRPVSFIAPPTLAPAPERETRHSRSRSTVDLASFAATTGTSSSSGSTSSSSSRSTAPTSVASSGPSPALDARPRHVRTEQEKKELLRKVMPNVEALEDRFRAMGLGLS